MEVRCYMCGEPCTGRLTPDIDIPGIPLCDARQCKDAITMLVVGSHGDDEWLER